MWPGLVATSVNLVWSCFGAFSYKNGPVIAVISNAIHLIVTILFKLLFNKTGSTKYL